MVLVPVEVLVTLLVTSPGPPSILDPVFQGV